MAKDLSGDDHAEIRTADTDFSYPIFNRDLTRATLQHSGRNDGWYKNGKRDLVASWRNVYLTKEKEGWTARFKVTATAH
jgi:hypothetical protein